MQGLTRVGSLGATLALAAGLLAPTALAATAPSAAGPRAAEAGALTPTPCPMPQCSTIVTCVSKRRNHAETYRVVQGHRGDRTQLDDGCVLTERVRS